VIVCSCMAYRREQFAVDEWYHCYNRGVDKRTVFESDNDYRRFVQTIYLSNNAESTNRFNIKHFEHDRFFERARGELLVEIGAYCLMPNHFHLLLREHSEGGITKFMHKLGTSYTMYFNIKHERIGNLFLKPFRSRHVHDDKYFRHVAQYIHLNSVEIFERGWKQGVVRSIKNLEKNLIAYPYSSYPDYFGSARPEKAILDPCWMGVLRSEMAPPRELLFDALQYYENLG